MQIQYNIQKNSIQHTKQCNRFNQNNKYNTKEYIPNISHARLSDNKRERAAYEGDLVCNALYLFLHNELHCTAYHWIYIPLCIVLQCRSQFAHKGESSNWGKTRNMGRGLWRGNIQNFDKTFFGTMTSLCMIISWCDIIMMWIWKIQNMGGSH